MEKKLTKSETLLVYSREGFLPLEIKIKFQALHS